MHDHMVACTAILGVDAPHMRRRSFEHQPRRGAGHAHRLIELPHAARPIGVLITVFRIALGLNDLDTRPVGLEFVGEHHWQAGANSGAHFRSMGHDRHQPGLVDGEVDVRLKRRLASQPRRTENGRSPIWKPNISPDRAAAVLSRSRLLKFSTVYHQMVPAADLIAVRMR